MTLQIDIVAAVISQTAWPTFKTFRGEHPGVATSLYAGPGGTQRGYYRLPSGMTLAAATLCDGVPLQLATEAELAPYSEYIRTTWPLVPEGYYTTIIEELVETPEAPKSATVASIEESVLAAQTAYERALALIAQGFYVFPSRAKDQHSMGWPHRASRDPKQITAWFGPGGSHASWSVSIFTGKFGEGDQSLLVVDVDPHKGGSATMAALEETHDFPPTRTHSTPRTGWHLIYAMPFPGVKSGADVLGPGADIRSAGGLIHFGERYTIARDVPVVEAPAWLVARCTRATISPPADRAADVVDLDQERAWQKAETLLTTWPPIAEGTRNGELLKFIYVVREYAATSVATTLAIGFAFCDACTPPYPHEEGRKTILSAIKSAKNPAGSMSDVSEVRQAAAVKEFDGVPLPEPSTDAPTKTPSQSYDELVARTDTGNAALLIAASKGHLRFVVETKTWLHWDGGRWQETTSRSVARRYARRVAEHYYREAATYERKHVTGAATQTEDERKRHTKILDGMRKWELFCQSVKAINAMIDLASTMPGVEVSATELNTHPWLLGVKNGVVDLQTGQLRPTAREELITKHCPVAYDPAATAPRWVRFIEEITGCPGTAKDDYRRRPRLAAYLQRASGYCLTGDVSQDKMFIAQGGGANGKDKFLNAICGVMGEYATGLPPEALMQTRYGADAERPTPNTAGLFGVRLALSSESKEGQKLDLAVVKRHTGGGTLTARRMRENAVTWTLSHKLWLMTNVVPGMDHLDPAIKGRLHVIPFDRTWNRPGHTDPDPACPEGDARLGETLKAEAPGILAWVVAGAVSYHVEGLNPPEEVLVKTKQVYTEQDSFNQWLAECGMRCETKDGTRKSVLLVSYNQWAQGTDRPLMTDALFLAALKLNKHHNHPHKMDGQTVRLYDIRLTDFAPLVATGLDFMQSEAFN